MRWFVLVLGLVAAAPAWCEDIVDVLRRSQDKRLAAMTPVAPDTPAARIIRASFERVLRAQPEGGPAVALRVIRGPATAETVHGHIILANEQLAELPERTRLFILAHELGHVAQEHWLQMAMLYQRWVPGEVTRQHTDAVNHRLARDASSLAHQQEFEADTFAAKTLRALGRCQPPDDAACHEDVLTVFQQPGAQRDTLTHPSAGKRLAALKAQALMP